MKRVASPADQVKTSTPPWIHAFPSKRSPTSNLDKATKAPWLGPWSAPILPKPVRGNEQPGLWRIAPESGTRPSPDRFGEDPVEAWGGAVRPDRLRRVWTGLGRIAPGIGWNNRPEPVWGGCCEGEEVVRVSGGGGRWSGGRGLARLRLG